MSPVPHRLRRMLPVHFNLSAPVTTHVNLARVSPLPFVFLSMQLSFLILCDILFLSHYIVRWPDKLISFCTHCFMLMYPCLCLSETPGNCVSKDRQSRCLIDRITHECRKDITSDQVSYVTSDCTIDCCTDNECVGQHLGGVYDNTATNTLPPTLPSTSTTATTAPTTPAPTTPAPTTVTTVATTMAAYSVYAQLQQECRVRKSFLFWFGFDLVWRGRRQCSFLSHSLN